MGRCSRLPSYEPTLRRPATNRLPAPTTPLQLVAESHYQPHRQDFATVGFCMLNKLCSKPRLQRFASCSRALRITRTSKSRLAKSMAAFPEQGAETWYTNFLSGFAETWR